MSQIFMPFYYYLFKMHMYEIIFGARHDFNTCLLSSPLSTENYLRNKTETYIWNNFFLF